MIISHTQELIFIKPKKVAGTSFEIALSKFCGEDCIITPIAPRDENLRRKLGYRAAQNFENVTFPGCEPVTFSRHDTAEKVYSSIPRDLWEGYKTISIVRNPYDVAISRYFWAASNGVDMSFEEYFKAYRFKLNQNEPIAPISGPARLDHFLRFENLEADCAAIGLTEVWETFRNTQTKNKSRPRKGASVAEMYAKFPVVREIVSEECAAYIDHFGYTVPS